MQIRIRQTFIAALSILILSCATDDKGALFTELTKLAEQGDSEAQYHVGMMLNNGFGATKDNRKAFEWFQKSAESGNPLGAYKVGCYFGGQFEGVVPIDKLKSFENKLVAAKAGYSMAQYDIGVKHHNEGKTKEALPWWKLSAEQGFDLALFALSHIYKEGKIVPQDSSLAYAYFKLGESMSKQQLPEKARESFEQFQSTLSPAQIKKGDEIIASWRPKPTPLTEKAFRGFSDAKKLVHRGSK